MVNISSKTCKNTKKIRIPYKSTFSLFRTPETQVEHVSHSKIQINNIIIGNSLFLLQDPEPLTNGGNAVRIIEL